MNRQYYNKSGTVATPISGGRPHYRRRPKYRVAGVYDLDVTHGDTFYELSNRFIGEEKNWDILADCNRPINPFNLFKYMHIKIPAKVIEVYRDTVIL
jgi:hypothetical protein